MTTPMTPPRLTEVQLAHVAMRIAEDEPKCHLCGGRGFKDTVRGERPCPVCDGTGFFALGTMTMRSIVAELVELRALLATPMPCGWPRPEALATGDSNGMHTMGYAAVQHGDCTYDPDEAVALGAALIRAALTAKGGAK